MKYPKAIIYIICVLFSFNSCKEKKTAEHEETEHHEEHEESNIATLSAEQMKSIQIELGQIEKKQLTASIKANGLLKVPNQNKASATALMGGVIRSILVQTGNAVRKGQVIATITNNDFIVMQDEYLTTAAKYDHALLEYKRQKELQEGNAGALKNLQASEAELKSLRIRKSSLQRQLSLNGINVQTLSSDNLQSYVSIRSPINGAVSNIMVNIGSYVEASNPIAEIVDNNQLHLDLYVYEKDLQKLKVGQTIHFTLTNNPGREFDADVYSISNTFEENTKAIAVHAKVKGNKEGLIDGMSITALVSLNNATVDAVPTSAIVSHEGQDFIFIVVDAHQDHHDEEAHTEAGHVHSDEEAHSHQHEESEKLPEGQISFEKIPIRKGTTDIGYSEITLLKDIPKNSKVVTNGAFFILAKMNNKGEAHQH